MISENKLFLFGKIINNYHNKQKLCLERVTQQDYFAHQYNKTNKGTKQ